MKSRAGEVLGTACEEISEDLPQMMFADGEEPVGVRALTYQSSRAINTVLNSLLEDEIQYLRASSFGKLVEIAKKPAFSGRLARFLLSRQLKVKKNMRHGSGLRGTRYGFHFVNLPL
ncbi:hypothetical protein Bca4012_004629 [Brassica carinata]|uniref:Uncharacterized protein n=1 Tax=Brassica carinata TaxID=52824 RepID=A0A8X7RRX5_BRACI|nr:hypothetical protein Bca52824_040947 [Brassica carinata]